MIELREIQTTTKNTTQTFSSQTVTPYTVVKRDTVSESQRRWLKDKLANLISENKFSPEDLKIYKNKTHVQQEIRKLAQKDANTVDRCMPNEELRTLLLAEIFQEAVLQKAG